MNLPPLPKVPEWFGAASRDIETDVKNYARQAQREAVAAAELARTGDARIAELEAALREARLVCEWIGETPSQRGGINGKAAQVLYRIRELLKD